jgi:hypothetical protein
MIGTVHIDHQDGVAEYEVTAAKYGFIADKLYVEIRAEPVGEHSLSFLRGIVLELYGGPVSEEALAAGEAISVTIPKSVNDEVDAGTDRFTNLYIGEHYDVDENQIVVRRTEAGASIRWTGVTQDPRYYDQRAKPTPIAVEASMDPTLYVR